VSKPSALRSTLHQAKQRTTIVKEEAPILPSRTTSPTSERSTIWKLEPQWFQCPFCSRYRESVTRLSPSYLSCAVSCVCCLLGCFLCSYIPCCIDTCKVTIHSCPGCYRDVGRSRINL
jgi:hypothetical protein